MNKNVNYSSSLVAGAIMLSAEPVLEDNHTFSSHLPLFVFLKWTSITKCIECWVESYKCDIFSTG